MPKKENSAGEMQNYNAKTGEYEGGTSNSGEETTTFKSFGKKDKDESVDYNAKRIGKEPKKERTFQEEDGTTYSFYNNGDKYYYVQKNTDGWSELVGPYKSQEEAKEFLFKHRPLLKQQEIISRGEKETDTNQDNPYASIHSHDQIVELVKKHYNDEVKPIDYNKKRLGK